MIIFLAAARMEMTVQEEADVLAVTAVPATTETKIDLIQTSPAAMTSLISKNLILRNPILRNPILTLLIMKSPIQINLAATINQTATSPIQITSKAETHLKAGTLPRLYVWLMPKEQKKVFQHLKATVQYSQRLR